jgi:hypothetical protein
MLRETPIPVRIVIGPTTADATILIGEEDVTSMVQALNFSAVGEGTVPRLALELATQDIVIEGAALVEVPREAGGFEEAADLIESMDSRELLREAANTLKSGSTSASANLILLIAEKLRKAGAG